MKKLSLIDKILLTTIFAPILPLAFFIAGWWGSYLLNASENLIMIFAFAGLSVGLILNLLFIEKILLHGFSVKPLILIAIYIFYSVGIFGFFMGVPIFNLIPGLFAGIYIGRKIFHNKLLVSKSQSLIRVTAIFTSFVMLLICIASALIALSDKYTLENLRGMLNLDITPDLLYFTITAGGVALVITQYFITKISAEIVSKRKIKI